MSRKGYHVTDQYGIYYLTFTIIGWADIFTRPQCREMIIDSLIHCKTSKGLVLYAYVIMSNHIHLIARTKETYEGISVFIRDFKKFTARQLINWILSSKIESRREWMFSLFNSYGQKNANNEIFQIWKRDNRPMQILTPKFAKQKLDYIHMNPVKAGIVDKPEEYLYSSARNYSNRKDFVIDVELLDLIYTLKY